MDRLLVGVWLRLTAALAVAAVLWVVLVRPWVERTAGRNFTEALRPTIDFVVADIMQTRAAGGDVETRLAEAARRSVQT